MEHYRKTDASERRKTMQLHHDIKQHPVLSYCIFVILWSFSWWGLILTVAPIGTLMTPPLHPAALVFMIVGAAGPILAGLTLTRIIHSKGSLLALLARLKRWQVGWLWLALLIPYGITIILYLLQVVGGMVPPTTILANIGPAIGIGIFAGLFEEMGWSGFMLPQLQRRYRPLMAGLLVGLFWGGVWHLYADYIGAFGNLGWWGLLLVILQAPILLTAQRILLAWVYNRTNGSLLLCVLFHFCISSSALLFGVTYPSSAVFALWAVIADLVWWAAAGAVILLDRGWWAVQKPQQGKMVSVSHAA
jgi:uncharacterized protein